MNRNDSQNAVTREDVGNIEEAARRRSAPRRVPSDKNPSERGFHNILTVTVWPLFVLYLELVLRLLLYKSVSGRQFAYTVLFSFGTGLICAVLTSFFKPKVNFILTLVLSGFLTVYFGVQLVYYKFFSDFFYWDQLAVAGDVTSFWRETLSVIGANWYGILLLLAPFVLYCIFGRKYMPAEPLDWTFRGISAAIALLLIIGGNSFIAFHSGELDDKYYYGAGYRMTEAVQRFGMITAFRLDTQYTLFGVPDDPITHDPDESTVDPDSIFIKQTTPAQQTEPPSPESSGGSGDTDPSVSTDPPRPIETGPNVLDIDFDALIAGTSNSALKDAHSYFKNRTPTNKGYYTGLFEGKNLIFMTVEGWAPAAIDPKLTPTLYKMKNEGFVFENYYCSNWGGSTATGEYANMSGNFYTSSKCLAYSADTLMKFTTGKMFGAAGYNCYAFHNHTYTYYSRNLSHPNMGFKWYAIGNWDKSDLFTEQWPKSDRELAENTLEYLTPDKPFHIYYMTVSGHAYQTWGGNANAKKHKAEILAAGLDYTDQNALSFIAAQYEVELMVKTLVDDLAKKGILEDTVFVMAPDHYPYQISDDNGATYKALSDLYKIPLTATPSDIEGNFNLYRAPLIIWSASMKEPVKVEKVCSAIDILPTVLNLFGMDYDSRLIMGHDILSDSDGFVLLNCNGNGGSWHWISDYGSYNTKTGTFTPAPGVTVAGTQLQSYISANNKTVSLMTKYSKYILNEDYYRKVFPNG